MNKLLVIAILVMFACKKDSTVDALEMEAIVLDMFSGVDQVVVNCQKANGHCIARSDTALYVVECTRSGDCGPRNDCVIQSVTLTEVAPTVERLR